MTMFALVLLMNVNNTIERVVIASELTEIECSELKNNEKLFQTVKRKYVLEIACQIE
jgi:hypothetical protein